MRILIACEFSGIVREAFAALGHGHYVMSCDLLPSERSGLPHYQGDVRDILDDGWDLMIAHPPCTYLAVSGARWWREREREQTQALAFVRYLLDAPIAKIALENPVGRISTAIRKPDQILQPWQFGEPHAKKTCLWLRGLPHLQPTRLVEPAYSEFKSGKRLPAWYNAAKRSNVEETRKARSRTFLGIAQAMADQWG